MGISESLEKLRRYCKNKTCGKIFYLPSEYFRNRYCSEECHYDWLKFRRLRRNKGNGRVKKNWPSKSIVPLFYNTESWIRLRYDILLRDGRVCACCGRTDGVMNVDHIRPRHKYPELAYDPSNLQVLCATCNRGKGARDETDWRRSAR